VSRYLFQITHWLAAIAARTGATIWTFAPIATEHRKLGHERGSAV
jgi:hypothetical protein